MSSKNFGIQAIAYGVLNGDDPPAMVGEVLGLGAVTSPAPGEYRIEFDPQIVGGFVDPLEGGLHIEAHANSIDRYAKARFTPDSLRVYVFDGADEPAEAVVSIVVWRWPNS